MRTPEGWEKAALDTYLKSIGAYVVKPTTFGYGGSGAADRVVCIAGVFWSLEVKREGKPPTAIQLRRIDEVRKAGGHAEWGVGAVLIDHVEKWRRFRGLL